MPNAEGVANFVDGLLEQALLQQSSVCPRPQTMGRNNRRAFAGHPEHEVKTWSIKIDVGDRENASACCSARLCEERFGVMLVASSVVGTRIDILVRRNRHADAKARRVARERRYLIFITAGDREQQQFGICHRLLAMMGAPHHLKSTGGREVALM